MFKFNLFTAFLAASTLCLCASADPVALTEGPGQPADIAPSAYLYRADRSARENPPEAWILLMQRDGLSFTAPLDVHAPAIKLALCGLLWEEVRHIDHLDLCWRAGAKHQPRPEDLVVAYFDGVDDAAHTWWNPRTIVEAAKPEVSADGTIYSYKIPLDTWGLVVSMRRDQNAADFDVPELRAYAPEKWKQMDVEVEWGYEEARAALDYGGRLETYDSRVSGLAPLEGDTRTRMASAQSWRSSSRSEARRGIRFHMLYIGDASWPKVWPYHSPSNSIARSIITVWTKSGNFSFRAADLENGPILAPEYGFFVRATNYKPAAESTVASSPPLDQSSAADSAREFVQQLAARNLHTIRERIEQHPEQTWEGAVTAMRGTNLPPIPEPPFLPPMRISVPSEQWTAQWNLGAWHLTRHAVKDARGKWYFNDFPFGILASETYMILRSLDLMGLHREAADGLDQWLSLPIQPHALDGDPGGIAGDSGSHGSSLQDRPLGHFTDGVGALTDALGPPGVGGQMDAVHAMGPGAIMFSIAEHFRLTGDTDWLAANIARIKANADWILRQRRWVERMVPNGEQLWNKGLLPAHVVTPDSFAMHMDFYESEAYYWAAVNSTAELLARVDPSAGAKMAAEAQAYRRDIEASLDRSITLTPVVAGRDGAYHSFIPFAPYVRGFASDAWAWRRCQGHIGAIYWDTVQSAAPLISPARLLSTDDPRVRGFLDVLEDRLLLENDHVTVRTPGFEADRDWFSHAGWQYQCGLEREANIYLQAGDAPAAIRAVFNQYAVDILPAEQYVFREHTMTGPFDKVFEESCFLERLRMMLVMEDGDNLWLARATPRAWLESGKKIAVQNAPTHFGDVDYEIVSDVSEGRINATVTLPSRNPPRDVLLQLRHPDSAPILQVKIDGKKWENFDSAAGVIHLRELTGAIHIEATYQ